MSSPGIIAAVLTNTFEDQELFMDDHEIIMDYDYGTKIITVGFPADDAPYCPGAGHIIFEEDSVYRAEVYMPTDSNATRPDGENLIQNWKKMAQPPGNYFAMQCISYSKSTKIGILYNSYPSPIKFGGHVKNI